MRAVGVFRGDRLESTGRWLLEGTEASPRAPTYRFALHPCRYHPNLPILPKNAYGSDDTLVWLVLQKLKGSLMSRIDAVSASGAGAGAGTPGSLKGKASAKGGRRNSGAGVGAASSSAAAAAGNGGSGGDTIRLPLATVSTIMLQLIDVLQHLHNKGYCYVDVNCDNVMVGGPQVGVFVCANALQTSLRQSSWLEVCG